MSAASCIRYVAGTCGDSNVSWGCAMNRYLVAVVAARAIWVAVPAAAVVVAGAPVPPAPAPTPPPVDGGASVQTLEPSRPSTRMGSPAQRDEARQNEKMPRRVRSGGETQE